jgi:ArsR family transcriptional regulator
MLDFMSRLRMMECVNGKEQHLSDEALELVAQRFSVLAEPMRLRLLHALMGGEKHVGALVEASGGTQANVSRHLQTLLQSGLVSRRKAGLQAFYAIADASVFDLCATVCSSILREADRQSRAMEAG